MGLLSYHVMKEVSGLILSSISSGSSSSEEEHNFERLLKQAVTCL